MSPRVHAMSLECRDEEEEVELALRRRCETERTCLKTSIGPKAVTVTALLVRLRVCVGCVY
jgi:hypothetical protein